MKDLEQLKLERASLESKQQLLIKENLESRELKEEKITELNIVKKEIAEVDKAIALLRKKIDFQANDFSYNKENKLFNKLIGANLIPCLSIGALFILTGNSQVITNMGMFSMFFTGIPTLLVTSGIYMNDLKNIREENKKEFLSGDESCELRNELQSLNEKRILLNDKVNDLNIEINKITTSIQNKGYQIVSIKNRISDINCSIRTGNVLCENKIEENVQLIK